jgi:hypothetical protein
MNTAVYRDILTRSLNFQVSELRSSLRHFTELVQTEQKGPNFAHSFGDRLKVIRRDLNTLSAEGENLKGNLRTLLL